MPVVDFYIRDEGNIYLLYPMTKMAKDWIKEHVQPGTWFGKALTVEHRYIEDLAGGMLEAGLSGKMNGRDLTLGKG